MVTGDVVEGDTVTVDIVQNRQARLGSLIDVVLSIVGLWLLLVTSLAPRIVAPAGWNFVGCGNLFTIR